MIKKKICGLVTAFAMMATVLPSFTTSFVADAVTSSPSTIDSTYTIPDLSIASKGVPNLESFDFVADMGLGLNLGNTFDAYDDNGYVKNEMDIEKTWCGVKTTEAMIDTMKAAGFTTLRLPVSWHNHVDENYNISEQWLNRVQEVMDYAIENDMYVILNIHHDNSTDFMYPDSEHYNQSEKYVTKIWEQLSAKFQSYDNHLIFECMNEPRLVGNTYEWWINPSDSVCIDAIDCVNRLNQSIVNTIRSSGGNNAERYIMVPGYCASVDGALANDFKMPTDTALNKLILSIHAYTPYNFALQAVTDSGSTSTFDVNGSGASEINSFMDKLYSKFVANNIPVVIGEFGARGKDNTQDRIDFAAYYIAAARARGITCCWWDNNAYTSGEAFGLLERSSCTWKYPVIVEALNKYAGNDSTVIITPVDPDEPKTTVEGTISTTGDKTYIDFTEAMGDKVQLTVDVADGVGYTNGCIAMAVDLDGVNYWVAYQWEVSADGDYIVDLTTPKFVTDTDNSEDEDGNPIYVTDEAIVSELAKICMTYTSVELQYWYAADSSWTSLSPASDYANVTAAVILKSATVDPTEPTTEPPTEPSSGITYIYGDANDDGNVDVSDVVAVRRYLVNSDKYLLSEQAMISADVQGNNDGLNAQDAVAIQKYVLGIVSVLPVA